MKTQLTEKTIFHYETAGAKGSTGYANSMFEVAVRRVISRGSAEIEFTSASGKSDIRIGRTSWIEIKTCCGETGNDADPLAEIHKARYVLYTPDLPDERTIKSNGLKCLETCYLFTAEQFIEMLCYIHKGGAEPHIKRNASGRWNIQTLRTYNKKTGKWSEKPYSRFWDFVDENDIPTATLELIDSLRK